MTAERFTPQVEATHYTGLRYDVKERFISYHKQIELVLAAEPGQVLEVGIGNGFVHRYLRHLGVQVHTVDFDAQLGPDTTASVLELPFGDGSFDTVCCFETLEHLPWENLEPAVRELARVSKRRVLLSFPDVTPYLALSVDRGKEKPKLTGLTELPNPFAKEHVFDGEHYWEIGKRGFPLSRITQQLQKTGLEVVKVSRAHDHPYHRYFQLEKG
jgi:SAM-dependent methyltransferase